MVSALKDKYVSEDFSDKLLQSQCMMSQRPTMLAAIPVKFLVVLHLKDSESPKLQMSYDNSD